jgi:hypothetical protein
MEHYQQKHHIGNHYEETEHALNLGTVKPEEEEEEEEEEVY